MTPRAHRSPKDSTARRARPGARLVVVLGALVAFGLAAHAGLGAFGAEVGPPKPRIASAPPKTTVSRAATFGIDAAPAVTLECSLDGSSYSRCSSRTTYRRLVLGDHTFRVRARSALGHAGSAASYDWRVRARPQVSSLTRIVPRPVLTAMPTSPFTSPNATFSWRPRGVARWRRGTTFACSLDGRGWKRCRAPLTYRTLRSGPHVFRVRAEHHGRRSRENGFAWRIELSRPGTPTVIRRSDPDRFEAVFEFEADDAAGFECRLDDGPWAPCASPVEVREVAPGEHEFCVRALSSEGVPGLASCFAWTKESSPIALAPAPDPSPSQFSITGDVPTLLTPGGGGQLPLTVSNPNAFDIVVTQIVVTVEHGSSQAGCDGPANLTVTQSNTAGGAVSIVVPGNGSVTLPAQGATAPVVSMLDLPSNQDACKGAEFNLSFSGTATG